jgi:hypothetical protein
MAIYDDGFVRGQGWAQHANCGDELRNLQALRTGKSGDEWRKWFAGHDAGQSAFKRIVQVLRPQAGGTPFDVAGFWKNAVAFDVSLPQSVLRQGDFVYGFADGALDVWKRAGGAGERGSELPDEEWLNKEGGPSAENDT